MLRTALPVIMQCRLMEREFIKGGKAAGRSPKDFPKKQIKMGIKVEHEHTPKRDIAQEIAMDHLVEFPDYYTRLHKMETQAKRAHRVAESALPVTKRCRLMEMIELKPWINRARANTPEAAKRAFDYKRVATLRKRMRRVDATMPQEGTVKAYKQLRLRGRLYRDISRPVNMHTHREINMPSPRSVRDHLDASGLELERRALGGGSWQGGAELVRRGDHVRDMGRPSPASKKPGGPQDLRLDKSKKKPWYQFWGGKEAPKPEPMDVKAPLVRKRYWAESSIVRRGILQEALADMDPDIRDSYGIKALDNRSARHANKVKKLMGADAEVYDVAGGSIYDPSSHVVGWHKGPSARRHVRAAKQAARLDQKYMGNAEKRAEKSGFDALSASPSDAMRRIFPRSSKVSAAAAKVGRRSAYTLAHELVHSKDPTSSGELRGEALANASLLNPRLPKKSARNQSMRTSMAAHLQNERNIRRSVGMSARDVNKKWKAFRNAGGFSPSGVKGALHLLASAAMARARFKESK